MCKKEKVDVDVDVDSVKSPVNLEEFRLFLNGFPFWLVVTVWRLIYRYWYLLARLFGGGGGGPPRCAVTSLLAHAVPVP